MSKANFRFSTDILRRLGKELNPSLEHGILELAKNAYDADATEYIVTFFFSIGRRLHGTPLPEVIERARSRQSLYIACTQLSKHCSAADPAGPATHIGTEFAAGRDNNHCCAGSVVISLKTGGIIEPQQEAHQNFISVNALTALCRN